MRDRTPDSVSIAGMCFGACLLILLLSMAWPASASADEQVPMLIWDASPEDEQVSGYRIWRNGEVVSTVAGAEGEEPPAEYKIAAPPGVYDFQVQAVNAWGVSPLSDAASTPADVPDAPMGVRVRVVVVIVEVK